MKKTLCIIISLILILVLVACTNNADEIPISDIEIGIIETRGNKNSSRLVFFDDELNEIGELPLKYATVGDPSQTPLVQDKELYVIPQGYAFSKNEKKVLCIDLQSMQVKKYTVDGIAMNSIAVSDEYIYTCNNLNGVSYINRCSQDEGKVNTIAVDISCLTNIIYANEQLYAFGTDVSETEGMRTYVNVYDTELNLVEQKDITSFGMAQYYALEYEDAIYFTSGTDVFDQATSIIGKINTNTYEIDQIDLKHIYPNELRVYKNYLVISHYDAVQNKGGGISFYDMQTKELTYYDLEHGVSSMNIVDNNLYILHERNLYHYDIETMQLKNTTVVSHMDEDYSYLTGIFAIE